MIFKLAFRNISRNPRRTGITVTAILFAVMSAVFMNSMERGTWDRLIDNIVAFHTGHIQIHAKKYWEEQSLDYSFEWTEVLDNSISNIDKIKAIVPRIEGFALAYNYSDTSSKGVLLVGSDPEKENRMSGLRKRVCRGAYFNSDDKAVLMAEGLAKQLKIQPGDTVTLISQGYHGANAAARYPVKGLVSFGSPELNKQLIYLPLKEAQYFFDAEGLLSSTVISIENRLYIKPVLKKIKSQLDSTRYEVMGWDEIMPELVQAKEMDELGNYLPLGILYVVISFGIFGTIIMMTKERQYEFAVLTAIGMSRFRLAMTVWLETVFLGMIGVIGGILISLIPVGYFHYNPINMGEQYSGTFEKFGMDPLMPTSLAPDLFYVQAIIVFIITSVLALYPIINIIRLKPVEAMKS
jgi:putative ABC transport system permease protein